MLLRLESPLLLSHVSPAEAVDEIYETGAIGEIDGMDERDAISEVSALEERDKLDHFPLISHASPSLAVDESTTDFGFISTQ